MKVTIKFKCLKSYDFKILNSEEFRRSGIRSIPELLEIFSNPQSFKIPTKIRGGILKWK